MLTASSSSDSLVSEHAHHNYVVVVVVVVVLVLIFPLAALVLDITLTAIFWVQKSMSKLDHERFDYCGLLTF